MSLARALLRRVAVAVLSVAGVLTALFAVFAFLSAPTPATALTGPPPGSPADGSIPLTVRYLDWMERFLTGRWGAVRSSPAQAVLQRETVDSVRGLVAGSLLATGSYAVPGILAATVAGTVVGYDTARGGRRSTWLRLAAYVAFGLPTVVLAIVALRIGLRDTVALLPASPTIARPPWDPFNLVRLLVPGLLVAAATLGAVTRHARVQLRDRLGTSAVRLVRAKGGGPWTVARHVLRRGAAQLVVAVAAETLGVVLLAVIMIEIVFDYGGFGRLLLFAAVERQPTLVAAVTFVVALVGIGGNLLADSLRLVIDPRTTDD